MSEIEKRLAEDYSYTELNLKWANEVLNYDDWKKGTINLIKLQTSVGKTTAILGNSEEGIKGFIDRMERGEKLLYLCNRKYLKAQIKIDLYKKYRVPIPKLPNGCIDFEAVDNVSTIGNVTIMTYQQLEYLVLRNEQIELRADEEELLLLEQMKFDLGSFNYIVCDEVHYLLRDSGFNFNTYVSYNELFKRYYDLSAIILITATDRELKGTIEGEISKNLEEYNRKMGTNIQLNEVFNYIDGGIDYSYIEPYYYNDWENICTLIKNCKDDGRKWLWFVSGIKSGQKRFELLKSMGVNVEFCSSEQNTDLKEYIATKSKFKCSILLTTTVLDNGINIKDDSLTNIVIEQWNEISFLQCLGRKRIDINRAQNINLFIPQRMNFSGYINTFTNELKKLKMFREERSQFDIKYKNRIPKGFYREYIRTENGIVENIQINFNYWKRLGSDIGMLENFQKYTQIDSWWFVREQLEWLGIGHKFSEKNYIGNVFDTECQLNLLDYLKYCANEEHNIVFLTAKDREPLIEKINYKDKNKAYIKSVDKLNDYLQKNNLPFKIEVIKCVTLKNEDGIKKQYRRCWKIIKL